MTEKAAIRIAGVLDLSTLKSIFLAGQDPNRNFHILYKILGVDISQDAVRAVNQRAKAEGIPFVKAQQMDLDDCLRHLADSRFDLIVSSYAIYYARDTIALLKGLRSLLRDQGVVFVCGPGRGTNREMQNIVDRFVFHRTSPPLKDLPLECHVSSRQGRDAGPILRQQGTHSGLGLWAYQLTYMDYPAMRDLYLNDAAQNSLSL